MHASDGVSVVTGAASGLGLATATRLARAGARVVLVDRRRPDQAVAAEAGVSNAPFAETDVLDADGVRAALVQAAALGPVRFVVNCAGIGDPKRVLNRDGAANPLEHFLHVLQVNLVGTFNVVRLAAEFIAQSEALSGERGVIVNTASAAAFDGQIGQAAYAASKGGVAAMTLPLARDLAGVMIRVVTIAPGIFETPLLATLPEAARHSLREQMPHPRRFGYPDEYAALVEHVISNPMLNGEVIRLDGAVRMGAR